ncbi:MAG: acetylglutamate kinase [Firmicutes bacterium]|nr:acetylglutamate kinase [Bacillota bacterium]
MRAEEKAAVLLEAMPYVQAFQGKTVVIKYGGHLDGELGAFAQDVVFLHLVGIRPVVVHGGGREISALMERLGKKPVFVEGLRVTDRETAEIAEMVLSGKVNQEIVAAIASRGGRAVGLSGKDGALIRARKKDGPVDLGFVGEVEEVDPRLVTTLLESGYIPVCAPIALGPGGEAYNLNADTAAAELAVALGAEKLVLLTDVPGLLRDRADPGSLVSVLGVREAEDMLSRGGVEGGMIPKLKACLRAVGGGVKSAHIVDGRRAHFLLVEIFTQEGAGTMVTPGHHDVAVAAAAGAAAEDTVVELERQHYWPVFRRQPLVLVRGEGSWVRDIHGRRYLDFVTGLAVCGLGHCHPRVTRAICEQARELVHTSCLYYTVPQVLLARELARLSGLERVFFANSGAEANEGAIKLARKFGSREGRFHIVTVRRSFHGRTLATMAATGQEKYHRGFGPLPPGFSYVPLGDVQALERAITPQTVAVMVEPVQGEGGIYPAPPGFMEALAGWQGKGILLICDEIQCGLGRTGRWFAFQHYGLRPDIVTLAKSLGGGVPIGAVLAREEVAACLGPGDHGSTFGGNPLACRAALAYLEALQEEGAVENAALMGERLGAGLRALAARHPAVAEVRSVGLMAGLQLRVPGAPVVAACRDLGLLVNCTEEVVIRLLPALNVSAEEVDLALGILDRALAVADEALAGAPAGAQDVPAPGVSQ